MYILTGIISDMFGYTSRCSMQLRTIWTRKQWNTRPHVRQKTLNHGLQNNCIDARKGWNYTKLWNVCHVMPRVLLLSLLKHWPLSVPERSAFRDLFLEQRAQQELSWYWGPWCCFFFGARLVQLLPHLRTFNSWMQSLQSRHMKSMH